MLRRNHGIPLVISLALLASTLGACADAGVSFATSGTFGPGSGAGSGTSGASSGSSSGSASGGSSGGQDAGSVGEPCDPGSVLDVCASAGLVCDVSRDICRLPGAGEQCLGGCAAEPAGLVCSSVGLSGTPEMLCLVPCPNSSDASGCPYGTSCDDPNLPGYCSAEGTLNCTPWTPCELDGEYLLGTCVPDGTHTVCLAVGQQSGQYGPCNPTAVNSEASELCQANSICQAVSLTLGQPASAGFCLPLCDLDGGFGDSGVCDMDSHCSQPDPSAYGVCLPGRPCALWPNICGTGEVCVPDSPDTFSGGCVFYGQDAGAPGDAGSPGTPCVPPTSISLHSPCAGGACVPSDGGFACTQLCDLSDAGRPYCSEPLTCTPLSATDAQAVVGACR